MSGGEPLWRRVAGLYLSGVPSDGAEAISKPASDAAPTAVNDDDPQHLIITLGEALDLVILAQGYTSPAVPILLRALIRAIRQVSEEKARAAEREMEPEVSGVEEPSDETPEAATAEPDAAGTGDKAAAEAVEETGPQDEREAATGAPEEESPTEIEQRLSETDQKVATLTTAVGQLIDVLQRRARNGGGVDRRASPRIPGGSAKIFIHDHPYEVLNWSAGGFLIRISESDRFTRGRLDFYFVLELPDETIEFQGRARPVRIERTTLAAEFVGLDDATAAKIGEIAARLAGTGQPA